MIVTEGIRIAALLAILALVYTDNIEIWSLAALGFLAAFGSVGFNAGLPALLPTLVKKDKLTFYNGKLELVRSLSLSLGPALAGALAAWFGSSNVFVLGVVLTCLTMIFIYNISHEGPKAPTKAVKKTPLQDVAEGASFIFRNTHLSAIMLVAFFWNCGWFVLQAAFIPLALNTWGFSPQAVGYALACMGFGLVVGSFFSQRIIDGLGFGPSLAFGPVISFVASLVILANINYGSAILPAVSFFLFGFGPVVWIITSNTLRQVVTPADMIGRVSSMYMTTNWGARPLGAAMGAAIGVTYGEVMCLVASAALFFIQMILVFATKLTQGSLTSGEPAEESLA